MDVSAVNDMNIFWRETKRRYSKRHWGEVGVVEGWQVTSKQWKATVVVQWSSLPHHVRPGRASFVFCIKHIVAWNFLWVLCVEWFIFVLIILVHPGREQGRWIQFSTKNNNTYLICGYVKVISFKIREFLSEKNYKWSSLHCLYNFDLWLFPKGKSKATFLCPVAQNWCIIIVHSISNASGVRLFPFQSSQYILPSVDILHFIHRPFAWLHGAYGK